MNNSVIGFPRVGKLRDLKFASEKYFKNEVTEAELLSVAKELRKEHLTFQKNAEIDFISSGDFSFYDGVLDTAVLLNVVPKKYKDLNLSELDTYFAMARGYQGEKGDVRALAMKKWFNTNYHYLVPEFDKDTEVKLNSNRVFEFYKEAKELGVETKPVIVGPFTFLKLAKYEKGTSLNDYKDSVVAVYKEILEELSKLSVSFVQLDEPFLVTDLSKEDVLLFTNIYNEVLKSKNDVKVLLQTYFGDIRDCYNEVVSLDFDGIGLDFIEGKKTFELLEKNGFPESKKLFAGVINGKNIWKSNYKDVLSKLNEIKKYAKDVVISTSCSLLHVPYTLDYETKLDEKAKSYLSFAVEKLEELKELKVLSEDANYENNEAFVKNQEVFKGERLFDNKEVKEQVSSLKEEDFVRLPKRSERLSLQKETYNFPNLPTTTIGSFPQTQEVKANRSAFRKQEIDKATYDAKVYDFIKDCIELQEEIGIDVLVHGEFERNDMVEFFGENLEGYIFTQKAWVQSYGTRCVKPPIIFGDIHRSKSITVEYSKYAQSLTKKRVKGMLTGPVTILNWSFPREDISLSEIAYQIGIAIREEVLELESAGIDIIQIDEAALKEKLPIRREDWYVDYLDWAIKSFRLCHSKVKPTTQIHTHMCYSEFAEIIKDIDNLDADVISFEASRSQLSLLDPIKDSNFETEVGPGVYDIHSPRVPSVDEIVNALRLILTKISVEKLWVNPDCGLKTRGITETVASLKNLVEATKIVRNEI